MGSGTNRKWWAEKGSRAARRSGTQTRDPKQKQSRIRMKAWRAEAARRSNDGRTSR